MEQCGLIYTLALHPGDAVTARVVCCHWQCQSASPLQFCSELSCATLGRHRPCARCSRCRRTACTRSLPNSCSLRSPSGCHSVILSFGQAVSERWRLCCHAFSVCSAASLTTSCRCGLRRGVRAHNVQHEGVFELQIVAHAARSPVTVRVNLI
jgi:hypothetical protein